MFMISIGKGGLNDFIASLLKDDVDQNGISSEDTDQSRLLVEYVRFELLL